MIIITNFHKDVALSIGVGCYVETKKGKNGSVRGGSVTSVIKDARGFAKGVYVERCDKENNTIKDYIKIKEIHFYEPYSAENALDYYLF